MTLLSNVINSWNVSIYEKNWPEIIECVRASLCDADNETRAIARQTYDGLQSSHPQIAESIFQVLIKLMIHYL